MARFEQLADALGVEKTTFRYAMPMFRRLVTSVERLTFAVPFGERSALFVGSRYWDRVVEVGLQGATYEFLLPDRLAARAA